MMYDRRHSRYLELYASSIRFDQVSAIEWIYLQLSSKNGILGYHISEKSQTNIAHAIIVLKMKELL